MSEMSVFEYVFGPKDDDGDVQMQDKPNSSVPPIMFEDESGMPRNKTDMVGMSDKRFLEECEKVPGLKERNEKFLDPVRNHNLFTVTPTFPDAPISDFASNIREVLRVLNEIELRIKKRIQFTRSHKVGGHAKLNVQMSMLTFIIILERMKEDVKPTTLKMKPMKKLVGLNVKTCDIYTVEWKGTYSLPGLFNRFWWISGDEGELGGIYRKLVYTLKFIYNAQTRLMDIHFAYSLFKIIYSGGVWKCIRMGL